MVKTERFHRFNMLLDHTFYWKVRDYLEVQYKQTGIRMSMAELFRVAVDNHLLTMQKGGD